MKVEWFEPVFGEKEKELLRNVLDSAYVNEGPLSKELEEKLKQYIGVKHVILTTSGTASLFLAIKTDQVIRNLKDYEIIISDFTCVATASAVKMAGATPVLCDIDKQTHLIDLEKIKEKITSKTKVVIITHVLGRTGRMEELQKIADEYGLVIIEDAAGALSSKFNGKHLGTFGKAGCFSLQANKIITSGQGGFVITDDDEFAETLRRIKDHGRLKKSEFVYPIEGYNFKFNDIQAAVALGQFEKIEDRKNLFISQRKQYEEELRNIEEVFFPKVDYWAGEVPLWVDAVVEKRDELDLFLAENEITSRKGGWPPVHRNGAYLAKDEEFPVTNYVSDNGLWLSNGPNINKEQISYVCDKIKEFYSMKKIYSKVNPEVLLHIINRKSEITSSRTNISPEKEYLQLASMNLQKGQTFRPHKHIEQIRTTDIAQESWVVIKGKVKAILYDLDDKIIEEVILEPGDCSITFRGGHTYEILEDDTLVYEYKTGPYYGQEKDKVFID